LTCLGNHWQCLKKRYRQARRAINHHTYTISSCSSSTGPRWLLSRNFFLAGSEAYAAIVCGPALGFRSFNFILTDLFRTPRCIILATSVCLDDALSRIFKRGLSCAESAGVIANLRHFVHCLRLCVDANVVRAIPLLASSLAEAVQVEIILTVGYHVETECLKRHSPTVREVSMALDDTRRFTACKAESTVPFPIASPTYTAPNLCLW
jgi:hypothetical protein